MLLFVGLLEVLKIEWFILVNEDCNGNKACINNHCVDPCAGTCGINAKCETRNHIPTCYCGVGYTGDPFTSCVVADPRKIIYKTHLLFFYNSIYGPIYDIIHGFCYFLQFHIWGHTCILLVFINALIHVWTHVWTF